MMDVPNIPIVNDANWIARYRSILEPLVAEGLQIYGLIGAESVYSAHPVGSSDWLQDYAYNFVSIVDQTKDIVRVYESFNEPNNWDATSQPTLSPEQYALLLQTVYLEVKHHNGHLYDPSWQVQLISGPLFTHDLDDGSEYLSATYDYGRNYLAWDWTHSETGSYPLDGIGIHLYVQQGITDYTSISTGLHNNISAIQNVINYWDSSKSIWISEIRWNTDYVGYNGQADALENALTFIHNDNRVSFVSWFCLLDWPGVGWGIRSDIQNPKTSWYRFQQVANQ